MRTAGKLTEKKLEKYRYYIKHMWNAAGSLPNVKGVVSPRLAHPEPTHVPPHRVPVAAQVFRGININLHPGLYTEGACIMWHSFSSSTRKQASYLEHILLLPSILCTYILFPQLTTLNFVNSFPGKRLGGSLFVVKAKSAKDISSFSAIPDEEEARAPSLAPCACSNSLRCAQVLFLPNSEFLVTKVVTAAAEKKARRATRV